MVMPAPTTQKPKKPSPSGDFFPIMVDKFSVGGRACEVYRFHGPSDRVVDTATMLARGAIVGANMRMEDGEFLLQHRDEIPPEYSQNTFVFPMWTSKEGVKGDVFVRGLNKKGVDWWCVLKFPDSSDWDSSCRLVRFRDLQLA